jgi:hypothetical protein
MRQVILLVCVILFTGIVQCWDLRNLEVSRGLSDQLAVHYIEMARLLIDSTSIPEEDKMVAAQLSYNHLFTIWLQTKSRFKVFSSEWDAKDLLWKRLREAIVKYADLSDPLEISRAYGDDGVLRDGVILLLPHPLEKKDIKIKSQYKELVDEFRAYINIEKK